MFPWFANEPTVDCEDRPLYIQDYLDQLALLRTIASKMCRDAKIVFVVCSVGEGEKGERLKTELKSIFPPGTKIILPTTPVGFRNGTVWETTSTPNEKYVRPLPIE